MDVDGDYDDKLYSYCSDHVLVKVIRMVVMNDYDINLHDADDEMRMLDLVCCLYYAGRTSVMMLMMMRMLMSVKMQLVSSQSTDLDLAD